MKEVYVIVSQDGGISYNMFTGKGTAYSNLEIAENELAKKNEWSKTRSRGTYELLPLEIATESEI